MNDRRRRRTYNQRKRTIEDGISYEIIELNESEPIVFQRDMEKEQNMKTVAGGNNKKVILVIPKEITTSRK